MAGSCKLHPKPNKGPATRCFRRKRRDGAERAEPTEGETETRWREQGARCARRAQVDSVQRLLLHQHLTLRTQPNTHCPHALPTTLVSELRCLSAARDPGVHRLLREERVSLPAGAVLPQARHRAVPDRLSVARGSLVHGRAPVLHVLGQVHRYVLQVAAALPLLCRGVRAPDRRRGCAEFTSNACVCDC